MRPVLFQYHLFCKDWFRAGLGKQAYVKGSAKHSSPTTSMTIRGTQKKVQSCTPFKFPLRKSCRIVFDRSNLGNIFSASFQTLKLIQTLQKHQWVLKIVTVHQPLSGIEPITAAPVVSHSGNVQAQCCLTSVLEWEVAYLTWRGQCRLKL